MVLNHEKVMSAKSLDSLVIEMKKRGLTLPSMDKSVVKKFKPLTVNQIYQLLKQCCVALGYDIDNENLYYLMNDARIVLVLATAGSGKTFSICIKILIKILLQGMNPNKVCILSFSKKSVGDIKLRIESTMRSFNIVCRRFDIYLDSSEVPNVRSLNSLTYNIVDQFSDKFGLAKLRIADDSVVKEVMGNAIKSCERDTGKFKASDSMVPDMVSLYNLLNETLEDVEDYKDHSYIINNNLTVELVNRIMNSYKALMKIKGLVTHSDTGKMILDLAEVDEEFKYKLSEFYNLVVVDEIQDVSEATFRIIKLLVGDDNELWGVGDGDQSIYKFKGSRPNNCQLFSKEYKDAITCHLTLNRRCGDNILEMGRIILKNTPGRKGEMPRALKKGGKVTHHMYSNQLEPIEDLVLKLSKEDKTNLGDYCIAFRRNFSAFYIVNLLLENGIPFQVRDDFRPGEDLFSRSIGDALALLRSPSNIPLIARALFKISGVSKQPPLNMLNKVLGKKHKRNDLYDMEIVKFYYEECMELEDCDYFYELPEKYFNIRQGNDDFEEKMESLKNLSREVSKGAMLYEVVPKVKELLDKNYWYSTKKYVNFPDELEDMVMKDMSREMSYIAYKHLKGEQEERIKRYTVKGMGVQLSTMHTLKGLEFKEVHIIELDSTNMPMVNNKGSDKEILDDISEEMRLLYVAVTRAKESLHMYWSSVEPSSLLPLVEEYNSSIGRTEAHSLKGLELELDGFNPGTSNESIDLRFEEYDKKKKNVIEIDNELELEELDLGDTSQLDLTQPEGGGLDLIQAEEEESEQPEDSDLIQPNGLDLIQPNDLDLTQSESLDLIQTDEEVVDLIQKNEEDNGLDLIQKNEVEELNLIQPEVNNTSLIQSEKDSTDNESSSPERTANVKVSRLLNKILTEKEIRVLPRYNIPEIEEEELNILHPREDFVEIKEGEALRNILGLICKEIM